MANLNDSAQLEALLELQRDLALEANIDRVLSRIAATAVRMLDCERATLYIIDHAEGELWSRAQAVCCASTLHTRTLASTRAWTLAAASGHLRCSWRRSTRAMSAASACSKRSTTGRARSRMTTSASSRGSRESAEFAVVREAANNAIKTGRAANVRRGSLGLLQMRESARLIGAQLSLDSRPGQGTRVCLRTPPP